MCRDRGAPIKLKNNRAQMEIGNAWISICRKYNVGQCTTEAHMPWQNEAESCIKEVKKMVNLIMDKTGAPNYLWAMCSMYVAYSLNHLAQPGLNWRIPIEAFYGYTPDISSVLLFSFLQKVNNLDAGIPISKLKRKAGRFVGIAKNDGDAMTFWIWNEDTGNSIAKSVIMKADNTINVNKRVNTSDNKNQAGKNPKFWE